MLLQNLKEILDLQHSVLGHVRAVDRISNSVDAKLGSKSVNYYSLTSETFPASAWQFQGREGHKNL